MRRDRRRKLLFESVTITHKPGDKQVEVRMIILRDTTPRLQDEQGISTQYRRYTGNMEVPLTDVKINDLVTRNQVTEDEPRGTPSEEQILVIEDVRNVWGIQRLDLVDRRPIP